MQISANQNYNRVGNSRPNLSSATPSSQDPVDQVSGSVGNDPAVTLGKQLPFRPASADWNQQRLADVDLNFIDGHTVTVQNSTQLNREMQKVKDGTLDSVIPSGHGHDSRVGSSMGLDVNDEGAPGFTANKSASRPRVTLDVVEGNRVKQVDFGKLCEGKFAPGGARLIDLRGCDTGNWGGLSQTMSRVLPGIQVRGTAGTLLENRLTGAERPAAGPDASRTYTVPRSELNQAKRGQYNPFPQH